LIFLLMTFANLTIMETMSSNQRQEKCFLSKLCLIKGSLNNLIKKIQQIQKIQLKNNIILEGGPMRNTSFSSKHYWCLVKTGTRLKSISEHVTLLILDRMHRSFSLNLWSTLKAKMNHRKLMTRRSILRYLIKRFRK